MKDRWLLLGLVATALGLALGFWGVWVRLPADYAGFNRVSEAAYGALKVFTFGKTYQGSDIWAHDGRLQAARWLGTLAFSSAAIKIGLATFRTSVRRISARWRRDHTVVLGETGFALAFARQWGLAHRRATVHLRTPEAADAPGLAVERSGDLKDGFMCASLARARRIVVAETEDALTCETALFLAQRYPQAEIFALLKEPWLAERLTDAPSAGRLSDDRRLVVISPASCAARGVLARHPLYVQMDAMGLRECHVLIVGYTPLSEALITDLLMSSLIRQGQLCRITMVGVGAQRFRAAFEVRHAGLFSADARVLDLVCVDAHPEGLVGAALETVADRLEAHPACSAFVALENTDEPLAVAYALRDLAARTDLLACPIFVHADRGSGLAAAPPGPLVEPRRLVPFGDWEVIVGGSGLLDVDPDRLARRFHEAYREAHVGGGEADVPWASLPERYRVANRRAVLHIPAKLYAAGFDLTQWLRSGTVGTDLPALAPDEPLFRSLEDLHALTALEHDRWSLERRLEGWRYGPVRDEIRRLHPDLVPFEALSADKQAYDLRFVQWLSDRWLPVRAGGLRRRSGAHAPEPTRDAKAWARRMREAGHSVTREGQIAQ